jgi:uncharacterized integral membrane protein
MSTVPPRDSRPDRTASVPRTRTAGLWIAAVLFAVVLLLLLIFILQNGQRARISFFGAHGNPPVGVALLLAAVFGVLLVALPGTARIVQLRILARRRGRVAEEALTLPPRADPEIAPPVPSAPQPEPEPEPELGTADAEDVRRQP